MLEVYDHVYQLWIGRISGQQIITGYPVSITFVILEQVEVVAGQLLDDRHWRLAVGRP